MIRSFRHRGLRRFYERGDRSRIRPAWVPRIRVILTLLNEAKSPTDMKQPTFRLHQLKGEYANYWSVWVSRNWRIIFRFEDGDVYDVHLIDYH